MTHIQNAGDMGDVNLTSDTRDCDIQRKMSKEENFWIQTQGWSQGWRRRS